MIRAIELETKRLTADKVAKTATFTVVASINIDILPQIDGLFVAKKCQKRPDGFYRQPRVRPLSCRLPLQVDFLSALATRPTYDRNLDCLPISVETRYWFHDPGVNGTLRI